MLRGSSGPGSLFRELILNEVKNSKTQIQNDCLARLYEADSELKAISTELDSFDGKKDPVRCNLLVNQLRTAQDKVISLLFQLMDDCNCERASRDYRMKFPDEILLSEGSESLNGQIWFGAECLAAGSNILNHNKESTMLRPMAKTLTQHLDSLRNDLRDLVLDGGGAARLTHTLTKKMVAFDHIFATFEYEYVRTMLPIRTVAEIEKLQEVAVLFSETLIDCVKRGLIKQDDIDEFQPIVMIAIPRLAIVRGLLYKNENPIYTRHKSQMCSLFQPFHGPLHSIRKLLRGLSPYELLTLERMLANDQSSTENSQSATRQNSVSETGKQDAQDRAVSVGGKSSKSHDGETGEFVTEASTSNSNYANVLMDGLQYPVGHKHVSQGDEPQNDQLPRRQDGDCHLEMRASSSKTNIDEECSGSPQGENLSPSPSTSLSSAQRSPERTKSVPCKCATTRQKSTGEETNDADDSDDQSRNHCDTENCCLSPPESDAQLEKLIANFSPSMSDEPELPKAPSNELTPQGLASVDPVETESPPSAKANDKQLSKERPENDANQAEIQDLFQKQAQQLLHRLFVAISGVADQLQSNFASDLRFILRHIFSSEIAGDNEDDLVEEDEEEEEDEAVDNEGAVGTGCHRTEDANEIYEGGDAEYSNDHSDSSLPIEEGIEAHETNLIDFESGYTLMDTINWENYYSDSANASQAHPFTGTDIIAHQHQARPLTPTPRQSRQQQQQQQQQQQPQQMVCPTLASANSRGQPRQMSYHDNPRIDEDSTQSPRTMQNTLDQRHMNNEFMADLMRSAANQGLIYGQESPNDRSVMDDNHQRLVQQHLQSVSRATSRIAASAANLAGTYGHGVGGGDVAGSGSRHHQYQVSSSGHRSSERRHRHHGSSRSRRARGPPAWVPDDEVAECRGCSAPFTWLKRRHHCRACGHIFCGDCSKYTKDLSCWGYKDPVRVCETCYNRP